MAGFREYDATEESLKDPKMLKRFNKNIDKSDTSGCWLWIASRLPIAKGTQKGKPGYGRFYFCGKAITSHRMAYFIEHGTLPSDKLIMHTCDNPACVNPAHLIAGTQFDNMRDKLAKGREDWSHTPKGEKCGSAKLTEDAVREIRQLVEAKVVKRKDIASLFRIHITTVNDILKGRSWQWLVSEERY